MAIHAMQSTLNSATRNQFTLCDESNVLQAQTWSSRCLSFECTQQPNPLQPRKHLNTPLEHSSSMAQNQSTAKPLVKFMPRTTYRPKRQDTDTKKEAYIDHDEVIKFVASMKDRVQVLESSLENQEKQTAKLQELLDELRQ